MPCLNATSLGLTHMEQEIPERAQALILDVVMTRNEGHALALTLGEAAMLREHALIDQVGRPTDRGLAVAGDFLGFQGDEH